MYQALGITGQRVLLVAGIYNCVGPLANLIFIIFIIDCVGRRRPLLRWTIAISIALVCEAAINSKIDKNPNHGLSIAGVFFIFCVTAIFSWSWGPISWVYMSEVMPMQIRARGNAFATGMGNWLVWTFWAPMALMELDWKFYFCSWAGIWRLPSPLFSSFSKRQSRYPWRTLIFYLAKGPSVHCLKTLTTGVETQPTCST